MAATLSSARSRSEAVKASWEARREAHGASGRKGYHPLTSPFEQRLARNVYHDAMTGCWLYDGHAVNGYPATRFRQKQMLVHRASWEHHNGPIPAGMFVCHRCDTPPCCNPDHLFLGTPKDNHADMVRKGRGIGPKPMRGATNNNAKLCEADIGPICAAYASGLSSTVIAEGYDVAASTIQGILNGSSWAHVDADRPRLGAESGSWRHRRTGYTRQSRKTPQQGGGK